jgi:polar amino acid transport system substrate-binding protein
MIRRTVLKSLVFGLLVISPLLGGSFVVSAAEVPKPGESKTIDAIKARGTLKVGLLGGYPWLQESTTGTGPQYEGPAWMLAEAYAKELGVKLEVVPVSHETKVPVVQSGQVDMSIAPLSVTEERKEVVDFVVYSNSSVCMFGKSDNPKLKDVKSVDDLNRKDIIVAYFTGAAEEPWVPKRFPEAQARGVTGSGTAAPVEEIMSGRADVAPIDKISWVTLQKQVPGLVSWPAGDDCLKSTEFSNEVGLAVSKDDPVFRDWARSVADEMKADLQAEELRLMKQGEAASN